MSKNSIKNENDTKLEMMINGLSKPITYGKAKVILKQMETCICKIKINDINDIYGTGTFCKIPYPNKNNLLPVLITNNHIITEDILQNENEKITIYLEPENKNMEFNLKDRIKYTSEKYDITIIEIKPNKDGLHNFLELDENIINNGYIDGYIHESIYILQYPKEVLSVSYGILEGIECNNNYSLRHLCSTDDGSSGSPILNSRNNKLIGIHQGGQKTNNFNVGIFLNFAIKDFLQKYYYNKILNKFNKKYKTELNFDMAEFDLENKKLGNEDLNNLLQIEFNEIKALNLKSNNITEIKPLEQSYIKDLEILNMNHNNISNIDFLIKTNFVNLKELHFFNNNISSINAFSFAKFDKLEKLDLGKNNISDISILEKVNFKELKMINLYKNNISDISVLEKVNFKKLEVLNLGSNNISNINILSKVDFANLKGLGLQKNKINEINVLGEVKFDKLEKLNLENNNITDIKILKKNNFKELKAISLCKNNISNIKVFEHMNLGKLEIIDLKDNKINSELYSSIIQYLKSKIDKFII